MTVYGLVVCLLTYSTAALAINNNSLLRNDNIDENSFGSTVLTGDLSIENGDFGNRYHSDNGNGYRSDFVDAGNVENEAVHISSTTPAESTTQSSTLRDEPVTAKITQSNNVLASQRSVPEKNDAKNDKNDAAKPVQACADRNEHCTAIFKAVGGKCDDGLFGATLRLQCPVTCKLCESRTRSVDRGLQVEERQNQNKALSASQKRFTRRHNAKSSSRGLRNTKLAAPENSFRPNKAADNAESDRDVFVGLDGGVLYGLYNPIQGQQSPFGQVSGDHATNQFLPFASHRGVGPYGYPFGFGYDNRQSNVPHRRRRNHRFGFVNPQRHINEADHSLSEVTVNSTFKPILVRPTVSSSIEAHNLRQKAEGGLFGTLPTIHVVPLHQLNRRDKPASSDLKATKRAQSNGININVNEAKYRDDVTPEKEITKQKPTAPVQAHIRDLLPRRRGHNNGKDSVTEKFLKKLGERDDSRGGFFDNQAGRRFHITRPRLPANEQRKASGELTELQKADVTKNPKNSNDEPKNNGRRQLAKDHELDYSEDSEDASFSDEYDAKDSDSIFSPF